MTSDFNDAATRRYITTSQQPTPITRSAAPHPGQPQPWHAAPVRVRVINWHDLDAEDARVQWRRLDRWVNQVRADYGLAPNIIPPLWHRHPELVWELSALHTFWLNAYAPGAQATSPLMFQRYFAEARSRLREWVSTCGTKLDTDRPTRQTAWPGQTPYFNAPERPILDRQADFDAFVAADVARRRADANVDAGAGAPTLVVHPGVGDEGGDRNDAP